MLDKLLDDEGEASKERNSIHSIFCTILYSSSELEFCLRESIWLDKIVEELSNDCGGFFRISLLLFCCEVDECDTEAISVSSSPF